MWRLPLLLSLAFFSPAEVSVLGNAGPQSNAETAATLARGVGKALAETVIFVVVSLFLCVSFAASLLTLKQAAPLELPKFPGWGWGRGEPGVPGASRELLLGQGKGGR